MADKLINKVLPIGSRRRRYLKQLLIRDPDNPGRLGKSLQYMAMRNVREEITQQEREALQLFANRYAGKRCFIIGNGPSLNKCDLSLLKDEYTFAVNGIFYKTDEMGFMPSFYMVEDGHVIDDNLARINAYNPDYKFFPALYKDSIDHGPGTFFFTADIGFYRENNENYCQPRFSKDFSKVAYTGQSVTYLNMQLAYYLGFKEVYLIGMDFSYDIPRSAIRTGLTIESTEDDVNHFHPDYFGKGKKWHDPKLDRVAMNYELAKEVFQGSGRTIYNATIGGELEIFDRVDYDSLFKP